MPEFDQEQRAREPQGRIEPQRSVSDRGNANESIKRPWQGTLLAILSILGLIAMNMSGMWGVSFVSMAFAGLFSGELGGILLGLGFIGLDVLTIIEIISFFIGWRWPIIVWQIISIIFLILSVITLEFGDMIGIGLIIWLQKACLDNPFYNQQKKPNVNQDKKSDEAIEQLRKSIQLLLRKGVDQREIVRALVAKGWKQEVAERLVSESNQQLTVGS